MPKAGAVADRLALLQSSMAARLLLIGIEGGSEAERAESSRRLAEELKASGLFLRVINGATSLNADDVRPIFNDRYLLSPAIDRERFSEAQLRQALQARLRDLQSPASAFETQLLPHDPTGEVMTIVRTWQSGLRQPPVRNGVWTSPDGTRALLVAEASTSGFDTKAMAPALAAIEEAFARVRAGSSVRMLLSGPGALASLSERRVRSEARTLGLASLALIILILTLAYRSRRAILICPVPLMTAISVAAAMVGVVFGGINGITLGFGATLLGIAVDYPALLLSHLQAGRTAETTLRRIWPTMRLCVATNAIGYTAMISASFSGLTQIALFSIAGLITAALVTRFVVPRLLPAGWAPVTGDRVAWTAPLVHLRGRPYPAILAGLLLLGASSAVVIMNPPGWATDIGAINPIPASVIADDSRLRADLGVPEAGQMLFVDGTSCEDVLIGSEAAVRALQPLLDRGLLRGIDAPSLYLPSTETQRTRQQALPPPDELASALAAAASGLSFRRGLFEPFLANVEAARTSPPVTPDELTRTPIGARIGALLVPRDTGWTALVLLSGVTDPAAIATAVAPLAAEGVTFLDMRAETNRLMNTFRDAATVRLAAGAALLVLVVLVGVRSWRRTIVVFLPMAIAIVLVLAFFSLRGEPLTLFHLVSLLLVVGIGIDYGLFFSRDVDAAADSKATLHALVVCSSTAVAGFSVLCFSSLPVLRAIGQTVTVGVAASVLLAALISRPGGRVAVGEGAGPESNPRCYPDHLPPMRHPNQEQ